MHLQLISLKKFKKEFSKKMAKRKRNWQSSLRHWITQTNHSSLGRTSYLVLEIQGSLKKRRRSMKVKSTPHQLQKKKTARIWWRYMVSMFLKTMLSKKDLRRSKDMFMSLSFITQPKNLSRNREKMTCKLLKTQQ